MRSCRAANVAGADFTDARLDNVDLTNGTVSTSVGVPLSVVTGDQMNDLVKELTTAESGMITLAGPKDSDNLSTYSQLLRESVNSLGDQLRSAFKDQGVILSSAATITMESKGGNATGAPWARLGRSAIRTEPSALQSGKAMYITTSSMMIRGQFSPRPNIPLLRSFLEDRQIELAGRPGARAAIGHGATSGIGR